jgi:hypothetical protein
MSSLRKQGPVTTDVCCYSMLWLQFFYHDRLWLWVPGRMEPVIGRRFAPTRWLARNDGDGALRAVHAVAPAKAGTHNH